MFTLRTIIFHARECLFKSLYRVFWIALTMAILLDVCLNLITLIANVCLVEMVRKILSMHACTMHHSGCVHKINNYIFVLF